MLFYEMTSDDLRRLARSLEAHYPLGDIMFLPAQLPGKTEAEVQDIISKMNPALLPTDYRPEIARSIINIACRNAF